MDKGNDHAKYWEAVRYTGGHGDLSSLLKEDGEGAMMIGNWINNP